MLCGERRTYGTFRVPKFGTLPVVPIDDARRELAALGVETREAKITDELLALGHSCKRASA
jgi:hypothetical protein